MSVTDSYRQQEPLHIQVRVDLMTHRRFADLLALLDSDTGLAGIAAVSERARDLVVYGALVQLWSVVMEREMAEGDLTGWSAAAVARISSWPFDRDCWFNALCESGFLERTDDGRLLIHHWPEFSGKVFINREQWRVKKQGQRNATAGDVSGTSPGHLRDVPERTPHSVERPRDSNGTSSRAKELESRELRAREDETPGQTSAHAGTHEADPEYEVSRWLAEDERPGDELPNALSLEDASVPFASDEAPGVIVKLQPIEDRARAKKRAASDDDIRELNGHFEPSFKRELEPLGVDWQQVYRRAWQGTVVQYEGASAQDLNDWLFQRLEQAKARAGVPPPSVAAMARAATATLDPYAAIEIRASA